MTQRHCVFKPITWYAKSRTTKSIPGLYCKTISQVFKCLFQEIEFSHDLIEKVMSAFDQMSVSDQEEYLMLYNKFENLESLPPLTRKAEFNIHKTLPPICLELSRE